MRKVFPLFAITALLSCNDTVTGLEPPSDPSKETFAPSLGVDIAAMTKTEAGVWYLDLKLGTGNMVQSTSKDTITDSMTINYIGFIKDGSQFDNGTGLTFTPGAVVPGMRSGLFGMKVGGKRKIVIPSELGYGASAKRDTSGKVTIPRQSTLIFDIDLTNVFNHVDTTTTHALRKP